MEDETNQVNPNYVSVPYEASGFFKDPATREIVWFVDREVERIESGVVIERRNQDTNELIEKYILPSAAVLRETERHGRTVRFYKDQWSDLIGETQLELGPFQTELAIVNWTATVGHHDIFAHADSGYDIEEMNETNNRGMRHIYVSRDPHWNPGGSPLYLKQEYYIEGWDE